MSQHTTWIAAIAVRVYCARLNDSSGGGDGAVERMIAKDKDDGKKLRGRAAAYIPIVRETIEALGLPDVYLKEAAEVEPW